MKTLEDLKSYIEDKFPGEPGLDCQEFIQAVCQLENWIYTDDSELNCYYSPCVYAIDGKQQLAYYDNTGWTVEEYEEVEIDKGNVLVTVREDARSYYINLNTGHGEGIYPKVDWPFSSALQNQMNIYKEVRHEQEDSETH